MAATKKNAKKSGKRRNGAKKQTRAYGLFTIAAVFTLSCIVTLTSLTPKRYEVSEGSVSSDTITAPRMVENTVMTEALQQAARNNVEPVYSVDTDLADTLISGAQSFFSAVKSYRNAAEEVRAATVPTQTGEDGVEYQLDDTREWDEVISSNDLLAMLVKLPVSITDTSLGYAILEADDTDIDELQEFVLTTLQSELRSGVSEDDLSSTLSEIERDLKLSTFSVWLKSLGETVYEAYLQPTNVINSVETTRAQEKAAAEVETVYIARGATIVEKGQTVTADQMDLLLSLDLVKGAEATSHLAPGAIAYLLCIYLLFMFYLLAFERETFCSSKKMTILALVLCITVLLEWLCYLVDPRITPAVFGVLLTCLLLSKEVAQAVNVALAMSLALLAGGSGSTLFGSDSILSMASMLAAGQATILVAERSQKRGSLIAAGATGGLAGAAVVAAGGAILEYSWNSIIIYAGLTMAAALILSVFCVGMLSVWENVFDIVTPARLHELANTNHPLLKRMMTSAPGTYHHSMMTASLAEGAAESIGANALLARTGAMYHDVGKLRRPEYFRENQNGVNIHDSLSPEESAGYIIAHQKDAEAYLARYRMPSAIRKIANEHHGTTLVAYFYYKAKQMQEQDGEPVIERLFRYQGNLPSSKESAIVMLADSCEAAVRSLNEPSREEVAQMVRKIVQGKMDDGQLKQCPLTLAEIDLIERSFLVTFIGLMHERIRYPGMELPR
ncbi:MAG TPA: HDIG domain-containing protein [Eubacteriales bacterium]|nr:HDIG domain-containing protein [Eubacteriales bacterium]